MLGGVVTTASRLPGVRRLRAIQFRRLRPLADGRARGTPVVRYLWARFLERNQGDITGRGVEIGTTETLHRYGGDRLILADAIDVAAHSPEVTIVADLARADSIPDDTYDCFINQFTMHVIFDVESALYHSFRILRPGGVLLVNFTCVDDYFPRGVDMGTGAPLFVHWSFTPIQVENLLRRVGLTGSDYRIEVLGNLFARVAYQLNVVAEELTQRELDHVDPEYPLLVCIRAVKPAQWHAVKPEPRKPWLPDVEPVRWDPVTGHHPT